MNNRRDFIATTIAAATGLGVAPLSAFAEPLDSESQYSPSSKQDSAEDPRITRARLSGPPHVTKDATIALLGPGGKLTTLMKGTNEWVCVPGDENKIGQPPMCMNPMGMLWMMDAMQGKAKPSNAAPGMIYMLCGATQRSNTDPMDRTSPAIPIGPHWMITWPFDAAANGLPTNVRDGGAWVMFAGTPYSYLHVCGSPWDGDEMKDGDKAVWTMKYVHPETK
jgi:hypothetical protein